MAADLFHRGHVQFLHSVRARFESEYKIHLTVALHTDEQIFSYKKRYPVQNFDSRKIVLESCRHVDAVIIAPDIYDSDFVDRFDFLAHGDDLLKWDKSMLDKYYKEFIDRNKLILIPYTKGISTTELISIASNTIK